MQSNSPKTKRYDTLDADGWGESKFTEEAAIKMLGKDEVGRLNRKIEKIKRERKGK